MSTKVINNYFDSHSIERTSVVPPKKGQLDDMLIPATVDDSNVIRVSEPDDVFEEYEMVDAIEPNRLKPFAWLEQMGHTEAYKAYFPSLLRDKTTEIVDEDGVKRTYTPRNISSRGGTLVGEILTPVEDSDSQTLYVNFAGTKSKATLKVDAQRAPGGDAWAKHQARILSAVNEHVALMKQRNPNKKVNVVISGHSLGGAYSQYAFQALQSAIGHNVVSTLEGAQRDKMQAALDVEADNRSHQTQILMAQHEALHTDNIGSLTLGVQNAPGVFHEIAASSNALSKPLKKVGMNNRAYFLQVSGDAVQTGGQENILSEADHEDTPVHYLKVDMGHKGFFSKVAKSSAFGLAVAAAFGISTGGLGALGAGLYFAGSNTLPAHKSKHFTQGNTPIQYRYSDNRHDANGTKKTAKNKSKALGYLSQFSGALLRASSALAQQTGLDDGQAYGRQRPAAITPSYAQSAVANPLNEKTTPAPQPGFFSRLRIF